jgi:DNA-binding MarR family transcriptional regulator
MLELVKSWELSERPGEIIRAEHDRDHPFLVVAKTLIRDHKLTFEERGFLCFILGQPTDWRTRIDALSRETKLSKTKTYRLIARLVEKGYIERDILKRRDPQGRFQSTVMYTVWEQPKATAAVPYRQAWKRSGAGVPDSEIPF